MGRIPDEISDLIHRCRKLREAAERLLEEAAELATEAEKLIESARENGPDGIVP